MTKSKKEPRRIIWSNMNLEIDDWRESYVETMEANDMEYDAEDDDEVYAYMVDMNDEYLEDERKNLDIQLNQPIIAIGDLGLWYGRRCGYKMINSGNIKDCLYDDSDYVEWYVDRYGNLRADATHHDGTNHYLYRVFKDGVTDEQIRSFQNKCYYGTVTQADITRLTKRLGDEIGHVYGWGSTSRTNKAA